MVRVGARAAAGALAAALALGASSAAAAETLDPAGAVRLALSNNPLVAAAESAVAQSEAERQLARTGYVPRVGLAENWIRSNDPVFAFGGKLRQGTFGGADFDVAKLNDPGAFTDAATQVAVQQNVWDADRTRLSLRQAGLGVEAAGIDRERVRDEVAFEALRAFWDAVLADEFLGVTRDAERAAQGNLDLASALVDEGLAVSSDRMSAEVRLAELRAQRSQAEAGTVVARAALARALGLRAHPAFELRAVDTATDAAGDDPAVLVTQALAARPGLRSLDRRIEQARLAERMARGHRQPTIGAGAQYALHGTDPLDHAGDDWMVGLSIRLPLFDGFETRARVAQARAERERAEAMRQALAQGIELEVRAAVAERQSAAERLAVARSAVGLAAEATRIVRERYAEGLAVIVELLGAEAAEAQARAHQVRARRDVALAEAGLDLALGREIRAPGAPTEN